MVFSPKRVIVWSLNVSSLRDCVPVCTALPWPTVSLTPTGRADVEVTPRLAYRLTGRALDQSGLVHQVANLLRSLNVNIESMETELEAAPITGAPIFAMDLVIAVPQDTPVQKLRDELAAMCDSLNIDWQLALL